MQRTICCLNASQSLSLTLGKFFEMLKLFEDNMFGRLRASSFSNNLGNISPRVSDLLYIVVECKMNDGFVCTNIKNWDIEHITCLLSDVSGLS